MGKKENMENGLFKKHNFLQCFFLHFPYCDISFVWDFVIALKDGKILLFHETVVLVCRCGVASSNIGNFFRKLKGEFWSHQL